MIKKLLWAYDRAKKLSASDDGRVFIRGAGACGRQLYHILRD